MSHQKNSPPHKASSGGNWKQIAGCWIPTLIVLAGLIVMGVVFGPNLVSLFGYNQPVPELTTITDDTWSEALQARREAQMAHLSTYGWVDEEAGIARIPIDQAMALIAENGLPVGTEAHEQAIAQALPPTDTPTPQPEPATPTATLEPTATPTTSGGQATDDQATLTPEPMPTDTPTPPPTIEPTPPPTTEPTPTVDLANVSFQKDVLPIFEVYCFQCHGGEQPEGGQRIEEGLSLLTYDDVMAGSWNGSAIEPGDADDSYLVDQVATGRMPKEGDPVPDELVQIIIAWVEAGAPDN